MKRQKGFTLIELLVLLAILGVIAVVVALNVGDFFGRGTTNNETATNETATNETMVDDDMTFAQLFVLPVSSLNLTHLIFMVDYCLEREAGEPNFEQSMFWLARANVYQNQIIINEGYTWQ